MSADSSPLTGATSTMADNRHSSATSTTVGNRLTTAFFALLRSGLYERPVTAGELPAVAALDETAWAALVQLARQQTVTGLIYRALTHLPQGVKVPGDTVLELMVSAKAIEQENLRKAEVRAKLLDGYTRAGLHPVVMKGATNAAFYAHPELRTSGDIDLYFPPEEFKRASRLLDGWHKASDGTVHLKRGGVDIDLHDRYFDLHCAADRLPEVGTPEATILMLSAHILKHAIGAGVGIRQCCDLTMALQALRGQYDPAALRDLFRRTGTLRWNRLLFSFLADHLGLADEGCPEPQHGLAAGERVSSEPLLRIVLEGGNFGHYAEARHSAIKAGAGGDPVATRRRKRNTLGRFLHRLPFSLRYAPRETLATMLSLARGNLFR